jgi:hypothetical protein
VLALGKFFEPLAVFPRRATHLPFGRHTVDWIRVFEKRAYDRAGNDRQRLRTAAAGLPDELAMRHEIQKNGGTFQCPYNRCGALS